MTFCRQLLSYIGTVIKNGIKILLFFIFLWKKYLTVAHWLHCISYNIQFNKVLIILLN